MAQDWWLPPRDYVGYGTEPPGIPWPGNKVLAVSFVLNYEEGAEHTPWNGDSQSCDSLHELHYSRPATSGGKRDGLVEDMVSCMALFAIIHWEWMDATPERHITDHELFISQSSSGEHDRDFRACSSSSRSMTGSGQPGHVLAPLR